MNFKPTGALMRGAASIAVGLIAWEILFRLYSENELLIAPPSSIFRAFIVLTFREDLLFHVRITLLEFTYGFSFALLGGVVLGYLIGSYKVIDDFFDPWFAALYAIPVIAFVPIIII